MNVLLPSEVARLVLGYLNSIKCTGTRTKFLEECPHLREYVYLLENGQEYPTTIFGRNLAHYLNIGYQYTQYLSNGDPLKYPFGAYFSTYPNRPAGIPFGEPPSGQESPAQQGASVRNGTPLTSPRQPAASYRTPRGAGWPGASPAERDRRSPADSIIDVTTVTDAPSSEPQIPPGGTPSVTSSGIVAPNRPVSEASIQTEDVLPVSAGQLPIELKANQQPTLPLLNSQQTSSDCATPMGSAPHACSTPVQNQQDAPQYQPSIDNAADVEMPSDCPLETSATSSGAMKFSIATVTTEITGSNPAKQAVPLAQQDNVISPPSTVPLANFVPTEPTGSDPLSPSGHHGNDNLETSTGFQPQISIAVSAASPKRKTIAPRKRPVVPPVELSMGPPSPPPRDSTGSTTRRMFDEFVQTQLAEKLAESINEAANGLAAGDNSQSQLPAGSSANAASRPSVMGRSSRSFAFHENSSCSNSSALQNDLLDLAISKALADPVVEELAQYMALKTTSGADLDTPTGTPLKGAALRTPFKQIAIEAASEPIIIDDTPSTLQTPPMPAKSFETLASIAPGAPATAVEPIPSLVSESRGVVLQPGQFIQLPPGFISVTTSGNLTALTRQPAGILQSSAIPAATVGVSSSIVSQSLSTAIVGGSDSMKIVVNSSPVKAPLPAPPVLRNAPRKPSPKVSPPESTTVSVIDGRTHSPLDEHSTETSSALAQGPGISTDESAVVSNATVTKTTETASSASTANGSKPPKKAATLGSHIRALDFDGLAGCAARYPNLYRNVNIYESTPVSPPRSKNRSGLSRKRKSPNTLCKTPKMARRAPDRRSKRRSDTRKEPEKKTDPASDHVDTDRVSGAPVTLSVFNVPTAIVSIPDEVRSPGEASTDPNPRVQDEKARQSCTLTDNPRRRQAIMVDIAPLQRRTAPVRMSSSRAKAPRGNRTSKGLTDNNNDTNTTASKRVKGRGNAPDAEFLMPTTPKKAIAPPTNKSSNKSISNTNNSTSNNNNHSNKINNNNNNTNSNKNNTQHQVMNATRLTLPLASIKGRISIGKMQALQEEARRVAKSATEAKEPSAAGRTKVVVPPVVGRTSSAFRHIAPKGAPSRVLIGPQIERLADQHVIYSTSHLPPVAPKISPTHDEKKETIVQSRPAATALVLSTVPSQQTINKEANTAGERRIQPKASPPSQGATGIQGNSVAKPLLVKPPAAEHTASGTSAANMAPFNLDICTLLDLVHKSNPSETMCAGQPKP